MKPVIEDPGVARREKPRRKWFGRLFLIIAWFLIVSVVLVGCYTPVLNYRGKVARDRIIAELEKRGIPTDLSYLEKDADDKSGGKRSIPGDREQAAAIEEQAKDGTRFYLAAFEMADFPDEWTEDIPFQGTARSPELCEPIDPKLAERVRVYLTIQKDFYSLIESARKCERFNYSVNILDEPNREGPSLDFLQGFRSSGRHLRLLCLYEQARRNADRALDACVAILDMNQSLNDEPWSIIWLIRVCTGVVTKEGAEQTLSRLSPSAEALKALGLRLLAESDSIDIQEMMKAETALLAEYVKQPGIGVARDMLSMEHLLIERRWNEMVSSYERMYSDEWIREIIDPPPLPTKKMVNFALDYTRIGYTLCPGMWQSIYAGKAEMQLKFYDLAGLPSHELAKKASELIEENEGVKSVEASISRFIQQILSHQANMRITVAALAVELYRIRHGDWPKKLSDAGRALPVDPFSGKELLYKRTDSGCTVYSIGSNQKDDGGKFSTNVEDDEDDIIFRLFDLQYRNKPISSSEP